MVPPAGFTVALGLVALGLDEVYVAVSLAAVTRFVLTSALASTMTDCNFEHCFAHAQLWSLIIDKNYRLVSDRKLEPIRSSR